MIGFGSGDMKNYRIFLIVLTVLLTASALSCGPNFSKLRDMPPEEQFRYGKELFEKEDYESAQIVFDRVARLNIISDFADSVQFLLAETYFETEQFILAQSEYERLTKNMPGSDLVKPSLYKIGLCYYRLSPSAPLDQDYTEKAIQYFTSFLAEYPLDADYTESVNGKLVEMQNKIAEKQFLNGDLYRKMGDYDAAIMYFDMLLREHYRSPSAPKTLISKADTYFRMKKFTESQETYQIFIENFPDHELSAKAREKMAEVRKELAKTAVPAKVDSLEFPY